VPKAPAAPCNSNTRSSATEHADGGGRTRSEEPPQGGIWARRALVARVYRGASEHNEHAATCPAQRAATRQQRTHRTRGGVVQRVEAALGARTEGRRKQTAAMRQVSSRYDITKQRGGGRECASDRSSSGDPKAVREHPWSRWEGGTGQRQLLRSSRSLAATASSLRTHVRHRRAMISREHPR
jgi:hypothetical protein